MMLIAGIYVFFSSGGSGAPIEKVKTTSSVMACQASRMTAERLIMTWKVTHPGRKPTAEGLEAADLGLPTCPGGGQLSLSGEKVACSLHNPLAQESVSPLAKD